MGAWEGYLYLTSFAVGASVPRFPVRSSRSHCEKSVSEKYTRMRKKNRRENGSEDQKPFSVRLFCSGETYARHGALLVEGSTVTGPGLSNAHESSPSHSM